MNVGIFLGHPAHFHNLKIVAQNLIDDGHQVFFAIKEKDILEQLMNEAGYNYIKIRKDRGNSKLALVKSVLTMEKNMIHFVKDNKIDILIGSTLSFAARFISHIPVINIAEDDAQAVPFYSWLTYPFSTEILTPIVCDNWYWNKKSIKYPSYQELGYLHPNHFVHSKEIVEKYGIDTSKPFFIMRFSKLNAHHDKGIKGISNNIALDVVEMLKHHGIVYITSERPLSAELDTYRIKINPLDMHHVMAFASLYIGDSQTMAAEAGVLGTPFVRLNDFVGRLSYLHELEYPKEPGFVKDAHVPDDKHYCLGYGHKSNDVEGFYRSIQKWLDTPNRKELCAARREVMLSEKIDYAKFLTWFIEHYPASAKEAKAADENFWKQFK